MKALIIDLDEVIWDGKIMYNEVYLKKDSKELLRQVSKLDNVKLIACSKNDKNNAIKYLKQFGLLDYFDNVYASWQPKHVAVNEILKKYNIRQKEAIFWDDEPVNRDEVKKLTGVHVDFDEDIYMVMKYFNTERLVIMDEIRNRDTVQNNFKGTFEEFVDQSGMQIEIKKGHKGTLTRITDLANRTNRLNATRNRYKEEQVLKFIDSEDYEVFICFMKDKYTNYGLIGEIIIHKQSPQLWFIQDICVSCRVIGRKVGSQLMQHIINQAKMANIKKINGIIIKSEENKNMTKLYEKFNFNKISEKNNELNYELIL